MTLDEAQQHFLKMLEMLPKMKPSPWPFACGSMMIDYLARMSIDRTSKHAGDGDVYIEFINTYMPTYSNYTFSDGARDLPFQMYYILRCGIVHSFSFVPDERFKKGRERSIVISHEGRHLSQCSYAASSDAVLFSFPQFYKDIQSAINDVFANAKGDTGLATRIENFLRKYPPLQGFQPHTVVSPPGSSTSLTISVSGIGAHPSE